MNATTQHPAHSLIVPAAPQADLASMLAALRNVPKCLGNLLRCLGRFMPPAYSSFAAAADDLDGVSQVAEVDFHGSQGLQ